MADWILQGDRRLSDLDASVAAALAARVAPRPEPPSRENG